MRNASTKPAPRLSADVIRAVERILARGDEAKVSALRDGLRVSSVKYKTECVDKSGADGYNNSESDKPRMRGV